MIAKRANILSESITIAISTLAKQMKQNGEDVLSFSAGEPDFDTPSAIKDAVVKALNSGNASKYTPVSGTNEVLEAIVTKLKKDNNLEYKTSEIVTNVGAKHSLFELFQAIIEDSDEVIIVAPFWVSYPEMVKFCGGVPVIVQTDESNDFKMTPEQLRLAITPKTKLVILNSPSNPTGTIYTRQELAAFEEILRGTDILVASDEIYEKLVFEGETTSFAEISDDAFKRTVTINGLSKCGAMPGWRFGYLASPNKEIISSIKKIQSQSTSNISSIVQAGAIPALLGKIDNDINTMKKEFKNRRDCACELFSKISGLKFFRPKGAFYIFINCKDVEPDSMKFSKLLLQEYKVAVVPGIGFGVDGYFRFSYATDLESIKQGIRRIGEFVKNYKK